MRTVSVLRLAAPAKINLFLRILGRRPDGLHQLQTGFQFIDLCDHLELRLRSDSCLQIYGDLSGIPARDNLLLRAAYLLRACSGTSQGADIHLCKRIPIGAGLGGGSSDAAAALAGLNQLWSLRFSRHQLAHLALRLGADVPLFVYGRAAWGEGCGELLYPFDFPENNLLLVTPARVSTADIFAAPGLTRNSKPIRISAANACTAANDCERVVSQLHPAVGNALRYLRSHADARLTGTGGGVFAIFPEAAHIDALLTRLPVQWQACRVRGMNASPLWQGDLYN